MFFVTQPIFIPAADKAQRYIDSITSLGEYMRKYYPTDRRISFAFGGWCFDDEFWGVAAATIKEYFPDAPCVRYKENKGKAVIINDLSRQFLYDNPYLISVDSDILFPFYTPYMFDRLDIMFQMSQKIRKTPPGVIGLKQDENGVHYQSVYSNQYEYETAIHGVNYRERFVWPNIRGGIGGGCLLINAELWKKIGGYRVMGVYSSDDGKLLLDARNNGYSIQVSDSISIIHPIEDDPTYGVWKRRVCQATTRTGVKADITQQIKEADDFWARRR